MQRFRREVQELKENERVPSRDSWATPSPQAATTTTSTHLSSYFPSAEVHQEDDSGVESDQLSHCSASSTSGSPSHSTLEPHHQRKYLRTVLGPGTPAARRCLLFGGHALQRDQGVAATENARDQDMLLEERRDGLWRFAEDSQASPRHTCYHIRKHWYEQ
jgi:hypothetical protein